jgi:hypothetical protein
MRPEEYDVKFACLPRRLRLICSVIGPNTQSGTRVDLSAAIFHQRLLRWLEHRSESARRFVQRVVACVTAFSLNGTTAHR